MSPNRPHPLQVYIMPQNHSLHFHAIQPYTVKNNHCLIVKNKTKQKITSLSPTLETGTSTSREKKGQMSVLSKRTNACARHEIDSKLETMRLRITENSAGGRGRGGASFYTFSKVCYLHKDYVKLLEEIFPKPTAHSQQSFFPLRQSQNPARV